MNKSSNFFLLNKTFSIKFKSLKLNFVFVFIVSLFMVSTRSKAEVMAAQFKTETLNKLVVLKKLGIKNIACSVKAPYIDLSVDDSIKEINNNSVNWIGADYEKDAFSTRWGAFSSKDQQTIYINNNVNHEKEYIGWLGLHEYIQVKGFSDKEFQRTLALMSFVDTFEYEKEFSYNNKKIDNLRSYVLNCGDFGIEREFKSDLGKMISIDNSTIKVNTDKSSEGGAIIVGNSGDTRILKARHNFIKKIMKIKSSQNLVLSNIQASHFVIELNENNSLDYVFRKNEKGDNELELILIPLTPTEEDYESITLMLESDLQSNNIQSYNLKKQKSPDDSVFSYVTINLYKDYSKIHPIYLQKVVKPMIKRICEKYECQDNLKEVLADE